MPILYVLGIFKTQGDKSDVRSSGVVKYKSLSFPPWQHMITRKTKLIQFRQLKQQLKSKPILPNQYQIQLLEKQSNLSTPPHSASFAPFAV